jgi:SAM-dependent methyltransferase
MPMLNETDCVTELAAGFDAYRPGYPLALREWLKYECGLRSGIVVADIGSGTGKLSRLLLDSGARVIGVEPSAAMRAVAEAAFAREPLFESVDATAEDTRLDEASVDAITAAQAFHWFDAPRARAEFMRISRFHGSVALIWNLLLQTPFGRDYQGVLERFEPDYPAAQRDRASESTMIEFFAPATPLLARFPNPRELDEAALRGLLLSSPYAPQPGHPMHRPMMRRIADVFAAHQRGGHVALEYETVAWYGKLLVQSAGLARSARG